MLRRPHGERHMQHTRLKKVQVYRCIACKYFLGILDGGKEWGKRERVAAVMVASESTMRMGVVDSDERVDDGFVKGMVPWKCQKGRGVESYWIIY